MPFCPVSLLKLWHSGCGLEPIFLASSHQEVDIGDESCEVVPSLLEVLEALSGSPSPCLARSAYGSAWPLSCPPWPGLARGVPDHGWHWGQALSCIDPPPRPLRLNPNLARSPNFTCTLSLCHWLMAHRGQQIRDPVQPAPAPGGRVADVKCMTFILTVSL